MVGSWDSHVPYEAREEAYFGQAQESKFGQEQKDADSGRPSIFGSVQIRCRCHYRGYSLLQVLSLSHYFQWMYGALVNLRINISSLDTYRK